MPWKPAAYEIALVVVLTALPLLMKGKKGMLKTLVLPLSRRLGSVAGGALLALGATQDQTTLIVNGLIALCLVLADVGVSQIQQKMGWKE